MRERQLWISVLILVFMFISAAGFIEADDLSTQSFVLKPGWNAIFLEVQPAPADPATIFAGLPLVSVWTWAESVSSVEFLVDPNEYGWNQSGWLVYRTSPDEAVLNDLHQLVANRAYLVKMAGTVDVPISIQGTPSTAPTRWASDSFNLVGFHVDPGTSVSFETYLAPSSAHVAQAVYSLDQQTGLWAFVDNLASTPVRSGESYWVFTKDASSYQGLLKTDIQVSNGLEFGAAVERRLLRITNVAASDCTLAINQLPSGNPVVLAFSAFDPVSKTFQRQPLATMPALTIGAGESVPLTLLVRREDFGSDEVGSVLEITDGRGSRLLIPVRARR